MTALASLMLERPVVLDGGLGTLLLARRPTVEDFGGSRHEGCLEWLNRRRPRWVQEIHAAYLDAGADGVETNTFGANAIVLGEYGLEAEVEALNFEAATLAREVARSYDRRRYVIGSVGPGTKLVTLGQVALETLEASYQAQMRGLLRGGVDALLLETCQDLGQIKAAIRAAKAAMAETKRACPLWVQVTVETTGTLLLGTEVGAVLTALEPLGIDLLGLNCGTGPDEMQAPLATLAEAAPMPISCLPNAGLPERRGNELFYPLDPEAFAEKVAHLAKTHHVNVVGGCCGTTPEHIRALVDRMSGLALTHRVPRMDRSISSLYQSVSLRQDPRPLIVGERTNAHGSRAFREAVVAEDLETQVALAKDQEREGAHALDVCVAYAGRDEVRDMANLVERLATEVRIPLVIDSTEVAVVEAALRRAPGKCVVNSIHFEGGGDKARRILDLCTTYGAVVVGLTIDERGMAHTLDHKLAVAQRLVDLVVGTYGFNPSDLIVDPLTFTLASGDEAYRRAAVETLEALRAIKERHHGVLTLLGVSNVSFGLPAALRSILNSLMLHHAVRFGLDLAIFNAAKVRPLDRIPEDVRRAAEDLLFDRRTPTYDPLRALLEAFGAVSPEGEDFEDALTSEARIRRDVLEGERARIRTDVQAALDAGWEPLRLLNEVLLPAMKEVGERFGSGRMPLPFVLQSAETMKAAVAVLEPHLPRDGGGGKGRVVLATVKGDVHDIGKNLVGILLANNGYTVTDLGIQQGAEAILKATREAPTLAVGLSGLLVKSTLVMRENLEWFSEQGLRVPVLLGGAALTRDYVTQVCVPAYAGPVLYAEDAFEALRHLEALRRGERLVGDSKDVESITVLHRGAELPLTPTGRSAWVRPTERIPEPPFWGVREVSLGLEDLFDFLDTFVVLRNRWSFTQGALSDEAFEAVLREEAHPRLEAWKERLRREALVEPRARYGYFPVRSEGDRLSIYDPDRQRLRATLTFPRQATGRRLCIADFFAEGDWDVVGVLGVTLGEAAVATASELHRSHRYEDYFLFHGLATELTEAGAEALHARMRRDLNIHHRDASQRRQLFAQGYQGSRYSFGYPACPALEGNQIVLDLLEGDRLGVRLTETFQMVPEFTTTALVVHHPQARYFAV